MKHILFVLHQFIDNEFSGGVERHVADLCEELRKENLVSVLYVSEESNSLILKSFEGSKEYSYAFPLKNKISKFTERNPEIYNTIKFLVENLGVNTIHVHHTLYVGYDIFYLAEQLNIPLTYTIHDYYLISPDFNQNYKFHDASYHETEELTQEYLDELTGKKDFSLLDWRRFSVHALEKSNAITTPSNVVKNEISKVFESFKDKIKVVPLGLPLRKELPTDDFNKNRICFFGSVHYPNKGKIIIEDLIPKLLDSNKDLEIHFLGTKKELWSFLSSLPNVVFHESYKREEVIEQIREINPALVVFLSLSKETFSYTLSESWLAGIPVISGPIGAQAERIEKNKGGIVLKTFDTYEIINLINEVLNDQERLTNLREEVRLIPELTIQETAKEYLNLYQYNENNTYNKIVIPFLESASSTYVLIKNFIEDIRNVKDDSESHIKSLDKAIEDHLNHIRHIEFELNQYKEFKKRITGAFASLKWFYYNAKFKFPFSIIFAPVNLSVTIYRYLSKLFKK